MFAQPIAGPCGKKSDGQGGGQPQQCGNGTTNVRQIAKIQHRQHERGKNDCRCKNGGVYDTPLFLHSFAEHWPAQMYAHS
jgi:hypothetical protein